HWLEWRSPHVGLFQRNCLRPVGAPSIGAGVLVRLGPALGGILESFPLSLEIGYGEVKLLADEFLQAELPTRSVVVQAVSPVVIERVLVEEDVFFPHGLAPRLRARDAADELLELLGVIIVIAADGGGKPRRVGIEDQVNQAAVDELVGVIGILLEQRRDLRGE